jgi:hypothetical protein
MSISSQGLDEEVVAFHPVNARLARCIRTGPNNPPPRDARMLLRSSHVAEDHGKGYQRRAQNRAFVV